ncbi:thymidylate synthase [Candidatus Pacearchaeota archaeon]|jgi:thymidylate synthase|nr:thymidylate synthase [Candidatus Pacearchaeota archaeon]
MPTRILPNQLIAQHTPAQAWAYGLSLIRSFGDQVITEDRKLTKEICNLHLTVLEPCDPDSYPIQGSGWDLPALEKYSEQLLSGENPSKFAYTYGERLRTYPDSLDDQAYLKRFGAIDNYTDQIDMVVTRLKLSSSSRRAIAITWIPACDTSRSEVPCLQLLDFLIRGGKCNLTAFFRSQDFERAWPANVYGLSRLLSYVASEVGCETGSLTTISASAHIYIE